MATALPILNTQPAGYKWTQEAAQRAAANHVFIRVGGQTSTKRALSGALRSWAKGDPSENQAIFNTVFRITGTPGNVSQALRYANFGEDQIREALNQSITRD